MTIFEILSAQASALRTAANAEFTAHMVPGDTTPLRALGRINARQHALVAPLYDYIDTLQDAMNAYSQARAHHARIHAGTPSRQAILGAQLRVERRLDAVLTAFADYLNGVARLRQDVTDGLVHEAADIAVAYADAVLIAVLRALPDGGDEVRPGYSVANRLLGLPSVSVDPVTDAGWQRLRTCMDRILHPGEDARIVQLSGRPVIINGHGEIIADGAEVPF